MADNRAIAFLDAESALQEPFNVVCKPFDFDSPVPPRQLIEINGCKSYALGFLAVTGAAGGTGKSSLAIVEELSLATGLDLFQSHRPELKCGRKRVWSMSLEDDETEHRRRVLAAMRYYELSPDDLAGYYLVTYRSDSPIEVGRIDRNYGFVASPQVDEIKCQISNHKIDVVNVDPFVNTHAVPENDNNAMNGVADLWRSIAQECGVAIGLTHHIRKTGSSHEVGVDDLRGAVSLVSAARLVRVLAPMSRDEAQAFSIIDERRRFYFWVNGAAKSNITPPSSGRAWYHMASVNLQNGTDLWDDDSIGVAESWSAPGNLDGVTGPHVDELARRLINASDEYLLSNCKASAQANGWIGFLVADITGLDPEDDKTRVKKIIAEWHKSKVIEKIDIQDSNRNRRPCFKLGKGATVASIEL